MALVQFNNSLTQAQFDILIPKDVGTLYFITDTKRLYKGADLYSEDVVVVSSLPPTGLINKIYVVNDGTAATAYIWDATGSEFFPLSATPTGDVVTNIEFDDDTNIITITYADGTTDELDLALGSIIQDIQYDHPTTTLTFTLVSGATTDISLADLVDIYSGGQTSSITVTVDSDGEINSALRISASAGNIATVNSDGLFVAATDISGKMNLVSGATANNIAALDGSGQAIDSGKAFSTTAPATGATNNTVPTSLAVLTSIETHLTWQ